MKLVELLAKELDVWAGTDCISVTQDADKVAYCWKYNNPVYKNYTAEWVHPTGFGLCNFPFSLRIARLAEDYQTAIVTKEMWEAERGRQNSLSTIASDDELWGDVKEMYNKEKEVFHPIYCRDRIKEIDALVESLEEERVSLVQALEDEGFVLVSTALVITPPIEDMSDWRNWKEGDLVECVSDVVESCERMTVGKLYSVNIDCDGMSVIDDDGDHMHSVIESDRIKWHSRPTK